MIRFSETLADFFSDFVGIHISLYFVLWALLRLAKGILLVFIFRGVGICYWLTIWK